jgi:DNA-directed RNA polymerase specialized sigma24 family protein
MSRPKLTVAEAIAKLENKLDLDIVNLFESGKTYQQVGEELGCSITRVQTVLRRESKLRRDLKAAATTPNIIELTEL